MIKVEVPVVVDESYEIVFSDFFKFNSLQKQLENKKILFVIDKGIGKKKIAYFKDQCNKKNLKSHFLIVKGGEGVKKGLSYALKVLKKADECGLDRKDAFILVGGGATLDMGGFAASMFHRGIEYYRIPSTLLAIVDAGIGSKNGVNLLGQKNFAGCFKTAKQIIIDPSFMTTLNNREIASGIAEIIKVALLKNKILFELIEHNFNLLFSKEINDDIFHKMIYLSITAHTDQIKTDPFEMINARPLDFGHQWGHRLEILSEARLNHGEAISIGMSIDCCISYRRGYISKETLYRILSLFKNIKLPIFDDIVDTEDVFSGLEHFRRHLGGELTITLLKGIGNKFNVNDITQKEFNESLILLKEVKNEIY